MTIYVYDAALRTSRSWSEICADLHVQWVENITDKNAVPENGVIVVHGNPFYEKAEGKEQLGKLARDRKFYAVTVSGRHRQSDVFGGGHCYCCGTRVGEKDIGFGERLGAFCADLELTGAPNFGLLEPQTYPQHLVAVYLLLLAIQALESESIGKLTETLAWEGFWEPALEEFRGRGGETNKWREMGLPMSGNDLERFWSHAREKVATEQAAVLLGI